MAGRPAQDRPTSTSRVELEDASEVLLRVGDVQIAEDKVLLGAQSGAVLHLTRDVLVGRS